MERKYCPKCGSDKLRLKDVKEGIFECNECGYVGPLTVEEEPEEES